MKLGLVIATIVLVAAGGVVLTRQKSAPPRPEPSASTQAESKLIPIAGEVTLLRTGQAQAETIKETTPVAQGDTVSTAATGRARLTWPNGTTTNLEEDSQVKIQELKNGGNQSTLEVVFGDIWAKVSRVLGADEHYQVQSQETVAAVRGTIFRFSYRNRRTHVQGVENTVRVWLRNQDETRGVDVTEKTVAEANGSAKLTTRAATNAELNDKISVRIRTQENLPTPSPNRSLSPSPTASRTPIPSPTATATPTPAPSPSTETTPTPLPDVRIDSVFPHTISVGDTFSLEGANFTSGHNTPRVFKVFVGGQESQFSIVGTTSIFVTPQLSAGVYDVSALTGDGITLTLRQVLTIR